MKQVQLKKTITAGEILCIATSIAVRHNLTYECLLDILRSYNFIFGDRIVPDTKYMLMKKIFSIEVDEITFHIFCPKCTNYLGERSNNKEVLRCRCGEIIDPTAPEAYFLELNISKQLQRLLSIEEIVSDLEKGVAPFDGVLRDVTDGSVFQEYLIKYQKSRWDLSFTLNTDGCLPEEKSSFSAWPQYIMIHELSPLLRRKNILLTGLWFQKGEPDMNLYYQPFVRQVNELQEKGFVWEWKGSKRVSCLHPLGVCVDAPARAALLKMSTFHGYNGCTYCHQRGQRINGVMKWPYMDPAAPDRTDQEIRERMLHPNPNRKANDGIWEASILANLKSLDLVRGIVVDFLHAVCEGGVKLFLNVITTGLKKNKKPAKPLKNREPQVRGKKTKVKVHKVKNVMRQKKKKIKKSPSRK